MKAVIQKTLLNTNLAETTPSSIKNQANHRPTGIHKYNTSSLRFDAPCSGARGLGQQPLQLKRKKKKFKGLKMSLGDFHTSVEDGTLNQKIQFDKERKKRAHQKPGYAVVLHMDPEFYKDEQATAMADGTLNMLHGRFMNKRDASGRKKPSHRNMYHKKLTNIAPNGKLHIIAHGEPVNDPDTLAPLNSRSISGYQPDVVAKSLVSELGLPDSFKGKINMLVCHSGSKTDGNPSMGERLLEEIRKLGPNPGSVKTLLGTGTVDEKTGRTVVHSDASVGALAKSAQLHSTMLEMKNRDREQPLTLGELVDITRQFIALPKAKELVDGDKRAAIMADIKSKEPRKFKRALSMMMGEIGNIRKHHMPRSAAHKKTYS